MEQWFPGREEWFPAASSASPLQGPGCRGGGQLGGARPCTGYQAPALPAAALNDVSTFPSPVDDLPAEAPSRWNLAAGRALHAPGPAGRGVTHAEGRDSPRVSAFPKRSAWLCSLAAAHPAPVLAGEASVPWRMQGRGLGAGSVPARLERVPEQTPFCFSPGWGWSRAATGAAGPGGCMCPCKGRGPPTRGEWTC